MRERVAYFDIGYSGILVTLYQFLVQVPLDDEHVREALGVVLVPLLPASKARNLSSSLLAANPMKYISANSKILINGQAQ